MHIKELEAADQILKDRFNQITTGDEAERAYSASALADIVKVRIEIRKELTWQYQQKIKRGI